MENNIDKKILLGAVLGFSLASAITFAQTLMRRREREKEVKEMIDEIKSREFPDISEILDENFDVADKFIENDEHIERDDFMEIGK